MKVFLKKMGKTISFLEVRPLSPTCASPVARKKSGFLLPSASTIGGSGFARRRRRRVGGSFVNAKLGKVQYHVLLLLDPRRLQRRKTRGQKNKFPLLPSSLVFLRIHLLLLINLVFPREKEGKFPSRLSLSPSVALVEEETHERKRSPGRREETQPNNQVSEKFASNVHSSQLVFTIFSINHFPRFKCKNVFLLFLKTLVGLPPPPTLCVALRVLSAVHTHTN